MIQLLLLLALILGSMGVVRWYLQNAPAASAKKLRRGLIWAAIIAALVMAATGRLAWLVPLIGALFAMLLRMLPLLVQIAAQPLPHWQRAQRQAGRGQRPTSGNNGGSSVKSRFLRMELNHSTGEILGEIIEGQHRGRRLSDLGVEQLTGLYQTYLRDDRESAALLRAYLERVHGDAWETAASNTGGRSESRAADSGKMTAGEAYEVLGLAVGATRDEIVSAHRRLMQKLHPDRGGSDYLAAKINKAKDVLLGF